MQVIGQSAGEDLNGVGVLDGTGQTQRPGQRGQRLMSGGLVEGRLFELRGQLPSLIGEARVRELLLPGVLAISAGQRVVGPGRLAVIGRILSMVASFDARWPLTMFSTGEGFCGRANTGAVTALPGEAVTLSAAANGF